MEDDGLIKGFIPELDSDKLPETITAISMIRARYGPDYAGKVGEEISHIDGICSLYYILGEYDFMAVIKARGRKDLETIINKISGSERVERSNTITVLSTALEDLTAFYRIYWKYISIAGVAFIIPYNAINMGNTNLNVKTISMYGN